MTDRQALGREAEARAEAILLAHGLTLVQRNYRCRGGEIDLVMRDGDALVFVEVRYRRGNSHGGALASVDSHKQRRLIIAARHYLMTSRWAGPCRFDVVGIGNAGHEQWVRDAIAV